MDIIDRIAERKKAEKARRAAVKAPDIEAAIFRHHVGTAFGIVATLIGMGAVVYFLR